MLSFIFIFSSEYLSLNYKILDACCWSQQSYKAFELHQTKMREQNCRFNPEEYEPQIENDYVEFCDKFGILGCIKKVDNQLFVAFRGTCNARDLMTDLDFLSTELEKNHKMKAHQGFLVRTNDAFKNLNSLLQTFLDKDPALSIIFTGHSMGGALATLSSFKFKLHNPQVNVETITFGQPKVLNKNAADFFSEMVGIPNYIQIITENNGHDDPITKIPPSKITDLVHPKGLRFKIPVTNKAYNLKSHQLLASYRMNLEELTRNQISINQFFVDCF